MSEQELKKQIFDTEDQIYDIICQKRKIETIEDLIKFHKNKNNDKIDKSILISLKNAIIRKCINITMNKLIEEYNKTNNPDIKIIKNNFIVKNYVIKNCDKFLIDKNFKDEIKRNYPSTEKIIKNSKNDIAEKYLIDHKKYTDNFIIDIIDEQNVLLENNFSIVIYIK